MSEQAPLPIEQILDRRFIAPDTSAAEAFLAGRRILITGAAGSIGSALSERLARLAPPGLVLLDHHENSLFQLNNRLRESLPAEVPLPGVVLADVRDPGRTEAVLRRYRPEVIFHLAAYKHVPLGEELPEAYVANNVLGTWQLLQAALRHGVSVLVYPSTDKAVAPVNSYGATKRIVERMLRAHARAAQDSGIRLVAARLVNVLGARGGVIETFARQIREGRQITITDPGMTRYWISEREALDYLIQAAGHAAGGSVLTLDLGEPVRVVDVARRLWELLGPPDAPFQPRYIGARPGERLDEYLYGPDELAEPSGMPRVLSVRERAPSGETLEDIARLVAELGQLVAADDREGLRLRLNVPAGSETRR